MAVLEMTKLSKKEQKEKMEALLEELAQDWEERGVELTRVATGWRFRAKPRGEKCDISYLIQHSPVQPKGVLMDKGFDSEKLHCFLREKGMWSIAPTRKNCRRGFYRKQLRDYFDYSLYWQRNIVESLIGAVKRLYGSHIRARTARMQRAEVYCRFISYNLRTIITTTFYRALYNEKFKGILFLKWLWLIGYFWQLQHLQCCLACLPVLRWLR